RRLRRPVAAAGGRAPDAALPMTGLSAGRRTIRCFPSADRQFRAVVLRAIEQLGEAASPEALEAALRERYITARVSPQDALASFTGEGAVWYVYRRDSPRTADADDADAGPAEPARPLQAAGRAARPIYSAAAVSSMLGVPVSIVVGWDEDEGYVQPQPTAGVRLYSRDDLEDLVTVKRLTTAHASPDEIRAAVEAERVRRAEGPFATARSGRRMLVLLAERDPYAAEMAEYFLRTEGYDVDVASSAAEA